MQYLACAVKAITNPVLSYPVVRAKTSFSTSFGLCTVDRPLRFLSAMPSFKMPAFGPERSQRLQRNRKFGLVVGAAQPNYEGKSSLHVHEVAIFPLEQSVYSLAL